MKQSMKEKEKDLRYHKKHILPWTQTNISQIRKHISEEGQTRALQLPSIREYILLLKFRFFFFFNDSLEDKQATIPSKANLMINKSTWLNKHDFHWYETITSCHFLRLVVQIMAETTVFHSIIS